jgi:hypothetical protein
VVAGYEALEGSVHVLNLNRSARAPYLAIAQRAPRLKVTLLKGARWTGRRNACRRAHEHYNEQYFIHFVPQ